MLSSISGPNNLWAQLMAARAAQQAQTGAGPTSGASPDGTSGAATGGTAALPGDAWSTALSGASQGTAPATDQPGTQPTLPGGHHAHHHRIGLDASQADSAASATSAASASSTSASQSADNDPLAALIQNLQTITADLQQAEQGQNANTTLASSGGASNGGAMSPGTATSAATEIGSTTSNAAQMHQLAQALAAYTSGGWQQQAQSAVGLTI